MSTRVYLDHNATSPLRPEAAEALRELLSSPPGNPSSLHAEGRSARARIEKARAQVAGLTGWAPSEVVFTSGGSESIAAAVHGVTVRAGPTRRRIVVSAVEHSAVLESAREAHRAGFELSVVPCDARGWVNPDSFAHRLGDDVALAVLQWANPETGVIQPIDAVVAACANAAIPLLVDAVQAAGKLAMNRIVRRPDLLAISAHKLGGPQGTGALMVRAGLSMAPLVPGGAQEKRRRGGTEAVPAVVGFGAAAEAALRRVDSEAVRLGALRDRVEAFLRERFPGVHIHGAGVERVANTLNFAVPGALGELLVIALDLAGFALSTGSACASGAVEPSHVLRAMGFTEDDARGAVRLSLGWSTTSAEIDRFLAVLPPIVERAQSANSALS